MNLRIYTLQLEETQKGDTPRGKTAESEFKLFRQNKVKPLKNRFSSLPLNPMHLAEPRDIEIKKSGCHCLIM